MLIPTNDRGECTYCDEIICKCVCFEMYKSPLLHGWEPTRGLVPGIRPKWYAGEFYLSVFDAKNELTRNKLGLSVPPQWIPAVRKGLYGVDLECPLTGPGGKILGIHKERAFKTKAAAISEFMNIIKFVNSMDWRELRYFLSRFNYEEFV